MSDIKFIRCPVVNGKAYASMDEFKVVAVAEVLNLRLPAGTTAEELHEMARIVVEKATEIIEILTLNTRSRPQMRKERKARKPRKQDTTLPLPDNT